MIKNIFSKVLIFLFVILVPLLAFISCESSKIEQDNNHVYTEDDNLNDEILAIRNISKKENLKALWRIFLVKQRLEGENKFNQNVEDFYNECVENCVNEFNSLVKAENQEKSDYFAALKIIQSFDALGLDKKSELLLESENLQNKIYEFVPKLKSREESKVEMSDMIKGTVTVYVDKGIKVENGSGYLDAVLGSGFFITKDGYLITNYHVISDMVEKKYEGYSRLYIKLAEDPETRIPAKVVGYDETLDLALLKTEIDAPYVFILGSSDDLQVGDKVFAIGSPLGLEKTLTSGIISSTDRNLLTVGRVFQLDAAVNSGNSGGPLIDETGKVQAVVFAGVQNYQGLNFAIPIEYLKIELPFLFNGGERNQVWIGAYGKTKRLPGSGTSNEGILVNYVMNGGNAFRSGLKENDTVVKINNQTVNSLDDLQIIFMHYLDGTIVKLEVQDENDLKKNVFVYLEKRPKNPGYEIYERDNIENAMYPLLGIKLVSTSTFSKKKFNVTQVLKGSSADEAGFSENDPVEILGIEFNKEKTAGIVQLYVKRRKKGYLDIGIALPLTVDSPYYF